MRHVRVQRVIGGRECVIFEEAGARDLLLQAVDSHDLAALDAEAAAIGEKCGAPFCLAAFPVASWNDELSPWPAPPVFGNAPFGGGAERTLAYVLDVLLPALGPADRVYLGGYSLSGFFALWAATQTNIFSGVAGVSPSVWYPGWLEYEAAHPIRAGRVYLSLGDREEKTRNPVMARVGDCIRAQHASLSQRLPCALEWNPGNHFRDPEKRTARGMAWLLEE